MSDFIDFVLRFQEQGLASVSRTTNNVMGAVGRIMGTAQRQTQSSTRSITEMNRQLDALKTRRDISVDTREIESANREIHQLQRSINHLSDSNTTISAGVGGKKGSMFGGGMGVMAGNLAAQAISAASGFAMSQGSQVLNTGMEGSMIRAQYEAMNGKDAGGKLYGDVTSYIQDSIFGNELYKVSGMLNSFGIEVNDVLPDLKMLGDVSGGNAERMQGLALAFAQVTAAGKMQGQDKMQFINAGFNPVAVYAQHTGKPQSYYNDLMSDGKFTDAMMKQSFIWATSKGGKYFGMLDEIGKTPYGKKAAMEGNIDNAKLQLGTALLPAMSSFMDALKPAIDGLPALMERLTPVAERLFGAFQSLLPEVMDFGAMLGGLLKPAFDFFTSPAVVQLVKNVLGLATTLGEIVVPVLTEMASQAKIVADTFGGLVGFIKGLIEWAESHGITKAVKAVYNYTPLGYGMNKLGEFNDYMGWSNHDPMQKNGKWADTWPGNLMGKKEAALFPTATTTTDAGKKLAEAVSESSDKITGGGNKQIIVNMHGPMIKDQTFHVSSMAEAKEYSQREQEEIFRSILLSAKQTI